MRIDPSWKPWFFPERDILFRNRELTAGPEVISAKTHGSLSSQRDSPLAPWDGEGEK